MDENIYAMPKSKAEHVARQLLDKIITAGLAPGTSFGTEADLLEQFDVSRPTLRESLRILESQGVLELRPGPRGGIMVQKPSAEVLAHGLSVFLALNEVPFIAVLKAREVIEPALAAEAAENGKEDDFQEMEESIRRMETMEDLSLLSQENRFFHAVVARASGNKVLETFWTIISLLGSGDHHGVRFTTVNQEHVVKAHKRILEACRNRDGNLASKLMEAHVSELEYLVRKRFQHLLSKPTSVMAKRGRALEK